jgi:DNA-binding CsgD family transcriptional regulator
MNLCKFLILLLWSLSIETLVAQIEDPPPRSEVDGLIRTSHHNLIKGKVTEVAKIIQTLQKKLPQLPLREQIDYWVLSANFFDAKYLIDSALTCYQKALNVANQLSADAPVHVHLYLSMGHFYLHLGIADVAMIFFEKVKTITKDRQLIMPVVDAHIGVVRAFLDLKQPNLAQKAALKTYYLVRNQSIEAGYILTNYWLGASYEATQARDSAKYYFRQIENFAIKHPRDQHLKTKALERLLRILSTEKEYQISTEALLPQFSENLPEFKISKQLIQAQIYARTQREPKIKPILDSIQVGLAKEMLNPEIVRNLKTWQRIYLELFQLCRLSSNQASLIEFEKLYAVFKTWEAHRNTQQNLVLRKLGIYIIEYYDQQRQMRDAQEWLRAWLSGASGLLLLLMLLGSWQYYRRRIENQRQNMEFKTAEAIILQYEIEESKRYELELKKEIESQKADITDLALENTLKNKQTQELLWELKDIKRELQLPEKNKQSLDNLIKDLRNKINANERREILLANIDKVNHHFYERLSQKSQEITQSEKEFCGLLRLQLSSTEIAILRNITPKAVKMARYRLRKKLHLPSDEDMYSFIAGI